MIAKKTVNTLIASAVALTLAGAAGSVMAESAAKEKCYGVVKAGANDCGAKGHSCAGKNNSCAAKAHSCAGQAAHNGDPTEFIALPAGVCERLASGTTTPTEPVAKDAPAADAAGAAADHAVDAVKGHAKDMMDKH